jgi:hypothetical protein
MGVPLRAAQYGIGGRPLQTVRQNWYGSAMYPAEDPRLHAVMGSLFCVSLLFDQQDLAFWRPGQVGMVTLGIAVVWMWRLAMDGQRRQAAQVHALRDRIEGLERELERRAHPH